MWNLHSDARRPHCIILCSWKITKRPIACRLSLLTWHPFRWNGSVLVHVISRNSPLVALGDSPVLLCRFNKKIPEQSDMWSVLFCIIDSKVNYDSDKLLAWLSAYVVYCSFQRVINLLGLALIFARTGCLPNVHVTAKNVRQFKSATGLAIIRVPTQFKVFKLASLPEL